MSALFRGVQEAHYRRAVTIRGACPISKGREPLPSTPKGKGNSELIAGYIIVDCPHTVLMDIHFMSIDNGDPSVHPVYYASEKDEHPMELAVRPNRGGEERVEIWRPYDPTKAPARLRHFTFTEGPYRFDLQLVGPGAGHWRYRCKITGPKWDRAQISHSGFRKIAYGQDFDVLAEYSNGNPLRLEAELTVVTGAARATYRIDRELAPSAERP